MGDYDHISDADILDAAGLANAPQAAPVPPAGPFDHLSDAEILSAAGAAPEAKDAPDGYWRAPSGDLEPEPTIKTAVMAQVPFASDLSGVADAGRKALERTFGSGDPNGNFSSDYEAGKKDFWAANERYKQDSPILDKVGQGIGSLIAFGKAPVGNTVAGGAGVAAAAPARGGLLAQSARSGAVAAPIGAAYGFGTSDGDLKDRVRNAEIGAASAGVLGTAAPSIARGVSAGTDLISRWAGVANPDDVALSRVAGSLKRDSLTPDDLANNLARAPDKPLVLADLAGDQNSATSRLARTVIDLPGKGSADASKFLAERDLGTGVNGPYDMFKQGGAADRIIGDVKTALGSDDAFQTATDLIAKQKADSAPLYDAFRAQPATPARQVQQFMPSPTFRAAVARANKSILDEGGSPMEDVFTFEKNPLDRFGADVPTTIKGGAFTPDTLDRIKQGIDDVWLAAKKGGDPGEIWTANILRSRFLQFMDAKYPNTYALARQAYAGPAVSLDALKMGADVFNTAPQDIASTLGKLPPEAQKNFRIGVQQAMISKVQNTQDGANEVAKLFGSPAKRNSVAAAFDNPQQLQALSQNLGLENRIAMTNQLGRGSRTAASLADQDDFGAQLARAGGEAAAHGVGHNPLGAVMRLATPVINRVTSRMGEQTTEKLADMLFNPATAQSTLQALRTLPQDQQRQMLARALAMTPGLRNAFAVGAGEAQ